MNPTPYLICLGLFAITIGSGYFMLEHWLPDLLAELGLRVKAIVCLVVFSLCVWTARPLADLTDGAVTLQSQEGLSGYLAIVQTDGVKLTNEYALGHKGKAGSLRCDTMEHFLEDAEKGVYGDQYGPHLMKSSETISDLSKFELLKDPHGHWSCRRKN